MVEDRNDGSVEIMESKYSGVDGLAKVLKVDVKNGLKSSDLQNRREVNIRIICFSDVVLRVNLCLRRICMHG